MSRFSVFFLMVFLTISNSIYSQSMNKNAPKKQDGFISESEMQKYPLRPIKIIVPWPAGGAGDTASRIIADKLTQRLGQPVLTENKPGGTGIIGAQFAAQSAADGYTLFMGNGDTNVLNPQIRKKIPYKAEQFEPVAFIGKIPGVLVSRAGFPAKNAVELIRYAKSNPGKVTFASWGIGSSVHVGMHSMEQAAGVEFLHVPFQGTGAAVSAVFGGQIDLVFITPAMALSTSKAGRTQIMGASSSGRISSAPEIATLSEQGFAGLNLDTWNGIMAPTGTPLQIRKKLNAEINAILAIPEVAKKLSEAGHEVSAMSTNQFDYFLKYEYDRWGKVIKAKQIKIDIE
jgi:tripartite-type tricarboxylate transporter receptor subunit TctC